MSTTLPNAVFVGRGNGAVCWYRCALPAMHLDLPWIGVAGDPERLATVSGLAAEALEWTTLADYEVVVVQYQASRAWLRGIRALQDSGVRVLFEVDDYVHSVRRKKDHPMAKQFGVEFLDHLEMCMRVSDGVICSTDWLARRYRSFNPRVWVCRNGIDLPRYTATRVPSETVTIGWAGAIGHTLAAEPWLEAVGDVLAARPRTRFVSIGEPLAARLAPQFEPGRCLAIPFSAFETYPAAMSAIDVAIAPASRTSFYRGKSDLRWLEASALGIPLVADPEVYPELEPNVTGFHASSADEVRARLLTLVDDAELRARLGGTARAYVAEHRSMAVAAEAWRVPLTEVLTSTSRRRAAARA